MDALDRGWPLNALTFDVEHWYTAALLRDAVDDPVDHVADSVDVVLDLLDDVAVSATFFVVGSLAETHPSVVERIADAGHELGSHGHVHRSVSEFDPSTYRRHLERSADAIESASGQRPVGFRAPNFSVDRDTAWAFDALADAGYRYDSSVFPMRTPMYGVSDAPRRPYRVDRDRPFATPTWGASRPGEAASRSDGTAGRSDSGLVEAPVAVAGRRLPVPVAGGFYARTLPRSVLHWGVRWLNDRGIPATLYFHPWEFNPAVKTDEPRLHERFVSFHGVDSLAETVVDLLSTFRFGPLRDVLADAGHPIADPERTGAPSGDSRTEPGEGAE